MKPFAFTHGRASILLTAAGLLAPFVAGAGDPSATTGITRPAAHDPPAAAASTPTAIVPATTATIDAATVAERLQREPDSLVVLDVRTPQEYAEGHVPGAINVPHDQVAARLADIPRDKDLVLYCRSGRRVGLAAAVLAANGYARLLHLDGDMPGWSASGRPVAR